MSKKYSQEEKQNIVERHTKFAEPPSKVIADVGISKSTFYRWLSEYQQDSESQKAVDIRTLFKISNINMCDRLDIILTSFYFCVKLFCDLNHMIFSEIRVYIHCG